MGSAKPCRRSRRFSRRHSQAGSHETDAVVSALARSCTSNFVLGCRPLLKDLYEVSEPTGPWIVSPSREGCDLNEEAFQMGSHPLIIQISGPFAAQCHIKNLLRWHHGTTGITAQQYLSHRSLAPARTPAPPQHQALGEPWSALSTTSHCLGRTSAR